MPTLRIAGIVLCVFMAIPNLFAEGQPVTRTVSVRGRADIVFPADHAIVSVAVVATGEEPKAVQNEVSEKAASVLGSMKELGIEDRDLATNRVSLEDITVRFDDDDRPIDDPIPCYKATIGIRITLRDLNKFDEMMSSLLAIGVNRIYGACFESTEEVAKAKEARKAAIGAAREKAEYLAAELGESIGRPIKITEVFERGAFERSVGYSNTIEFQEGPRSRSTTSAISPQDLMVGAEIDVVFELSN